MIAPQLLTLAAFVGARHRMSRLNTRAKLEVFQSRRLKRFLQTHVPRVEAFKGSAFFTLQDAPIMDKAKLMERFEHYNRLGLSADTGWQMFDGMMSCPKNYSIGSSTGTSGNRGLYLISDRERYKWLGVILSRAFPRILTQSERVAVILPQASRLYDAANESKRLQLKFFDLVHGVEAQIDAVANFNPTVIIAPPRVLTVLAEADRPIAPRQVFSGAEVLDPRDKEIIEARFDVCVREIYMATEGLFAVACEYGTLHLIEDHIAFELEPVDGKQILKTPLITDYTRQTQIMLRYRMNDLLEVSNETCLCESPHRSITAIVGRQDDAFRLINHSGEMMTFTPDVIRNAVLNTDRQISDYRVTQIGENKVQLELPVAQRELLAPATQALQHLFEYAGAAPNLIPRVGRFADTGAKKRRRVLVDFETR